MSPARLMVTSLALVVLSHPAFSEPRMKDKGVNERLNDEVVYNPFGPLNAKPVTPVATVASQPAITSAVATPRRKKASEPASPPAPPPTAPPLPFIAVGSISGAQVTGSKPVAFIRQQEQLLVVRSGDLLSQLYRVEAITTQHIEFTYLPLKQRQSLALSP
jgi:hypothetical protein